MHTSSLSDVSFAIRMEGYSDFVIYLFVNKQFSTENLHNISFENYLLENTKKNKVTCYVNPDYDTNKLILENKQLLKYDDKINLLYSNYKYGKMTDYPNLKIKNGSFDRNYSKNIPLENKLALFDKVLSNPKFSPTKLDTNINNSEIFKFLANSAFYITADISIPSLKEFVGKELDRIKNDIFYYNILLQDIFEYQKFKSTHLNIIVDNYGSYIKANEMSHNNLDELTKYVYHFLNNIDLQLSALYKIKKIFCSNNKKNVIISGQYETMKTIEYLTTKFGMKITHVSNKLADINEININFNVIRSEAYPILLHLDEKLDISHFPEHFE